MANHRFHCYICSKNGKFDFEGKRYCGKHIKLAESQAKS